MHSLQLQETKPHSAHALCGVNHTSRILRAMGNCTHFLAFKSHTNIISKTSNSTNPLWYQPLNIEQEITVGFNSNQKQLFFIHRAEKTDCMLSCADFHKFSSSESLSIGDKKVKINTLQKIIRLVYL
jgi:hypothetical protein